MVKVSNFDPKIKMLQSKYIEEVFVKQLLNIDFFTDMLLNFMSEMDLNLKDKPGSKIDLRGILELFEASHLAVDGEEIMLKAKAFSFQYLIGNYLDMDVNLAKQVACASEIPCHRKVLWFDVRHQIQTYKLEDNKNPILLELAKLNFNIVQAMHLEDLKEMSR